MGVNFKLASTSSSLFNSEGISQRCFSHRKRVGNNISWVLVQNSLTALISQEQLQLIDTAIYIHAE